MPIDLPTQLPADMPHQCVFQAARDYQISPAVLYAVRTKEGGTAGKSSRLNANNTRDHNQTQINDKWISFFYKNEGINPSLLVTDPCIGIRATGFIIRSEINRVGDFWRGVGNYHSRTPEKNQLYLNDIYPLYQRYGEILRQYGWVK